MLEEQLEEERGRNPGHLEPGLRGTWASVEPFLVTSVSSATREARSSMAGVNMAGRAWRFGSRGAGMCLPPGGAMKPGGGTRGRPPLAPAFLGAGEEGEGEAPPVMSDV